MILIKLIKAVSEIDRATSPSANLVKTFEVTPPGAAAINMTPNASSIGTLRIIIREYATNGKIINWQTNPIKKSFGFLNTLKKSWNVKDAPRPSINSARAIGAIVVTIPIISLSPQRKYIKYIYKIKEFYEIVKRLSVFRKNFALFLKIFLW